MKKLTKENVTVGELAQSLLLPDWFGSEKYWASLARDEYDFMPAKAQEAYDKLPDGEGL